MDIIGSIDEAPDLVINFKGNKIRVHKSVLIEASEYFRAMLTKDFKEADQNEINIEFDVNVEIFQAIINYIYTDEIEFSTNNVEDISKTSRYFMLENLTKSSFDFKMKFFERIFKNESFLDWELSTIQEVLQSDRVVVSTEKKMLLFATKWTEYDFVNRRKSAAEILQNVRFSRITKEQLSEAAENFAFLIPRGILSKSTAPRQYHKKGLYLLAEDYFQRYCPIDGTVTNLKKFNYYLPPQSYVVNDEKICIFPTEILEWRTIECYSHVYDPLTDSYTEMSIAVDEVVQFVERRNQSDWFHGTVTLKYCSLGGVIYAFVFHENDVKVFALRSNAWVSTGPTLPIQLHFQTEIRLTACGDSIYLVPYFNDNKVTKLFRYKPSTQEVTEISCPFSFKAYPFSSYKTKLLLRATVDHDVDASYITTYDTITKDFQQYLFPGLTYHTLIAIYNDSIYFISQPQGDRYSKESQVKHFDMSIFDEVLSHVEPPLPVLKTEMSFIHHVVVIQ